MTTAHDAATIKAATAKANAEREERQYLLRLGACFRTFVAAWKGERLEGIFYDLPPSEQEAIIKKALAAGDKLWGKARP